MRVELPPSPPKLGRYGEKDDAAASKAVVPEVDAAGSSPATGTKIESWGRWINPTVC